MGAKVPISQKLAISKNEAYGYVGIPSLVQSWMFASRRARIGEEKWVIIVREGGRGRETMLDRRSVDRAYGLYRQGIQPPPVPSRQNRKPLNGPEL